MFSHDTYGLILTGGQSTRMGTDKALLNYHGRPQREYLFALLQKFCGKVFTSCRSDQHVPPELNPIFDRFDFNGPMNGILSALELHPEKKWLAIAVDMPFIDEAGIRELIKNCDELKLATCFAHPTDKLPEPLFTLWMPAARTYLQKFVRPGRTSPRQFLRTHPVHIISTIEEKSLLNINHKHEFLSLKEHQRQADVLSS